ncbi:LysR family transcriptional regulator [Marinicauda sp. Alg238-R41]|uniref:LysR family transcriptional regulator n=1 Tax=Marinicauda sp. Alg238-R41 TaxID=2993447 RepID=UPI0022E6E3E1|nr:LysR family transcriptional regulator [Marinicauda sp. Alg238-R41]
MTWQVIQFDWNQARAFLATLEEGSFSAAGRALGLTQPTLSRQIAALEVHLGVTLFERGPRTMIATEAALALADHVRAMADAAAKVSLTAAGQSSTVSGLVTISATSLTAAYHLPEIIATLKATAPRIQIDILASNELSDLSRREADIAIRHAAPRAADLIARKLGDMSAHLYGSPGYLDRAGRPVTLNDLARHELLGFASRAQVRAVLDEFGLPIGDDQIRYRAEDGIILLELARAGLGLCVLPDDIVARAGGLEPVLTEAFHVPVPSWLVTHREVKTSRRIRIVIDALADGLAPAVA